MEKIKQKKSLFKIVSNIVDIIVFPVIIMSLCVSCFMLLSKSDKAITPILNHAFVRVLSNSMSTYCDEANRSFFKGDIAIIKSESSYRVGDVIAFFEYKDPVDSYEMLNLTTYSSQQIPKKDKNGNIVKDENGQIIYYTNNYYPVKDESGNVIFDENLFNAVQNANVGETIAGTSYTKKAVPANRTLRDDVDASKVRVLFHQIIQIKIDTSGTVFYITKGTNNASSDTFAIRQDMVFGKYITTSKWISDFVGFCSSSTGLILLVIVPISIIIFFESLSILEQINNIILEKNVIARASIFDSKESIKAKIGEEMPFFNKIYLYDVMSKEYKKDLYKFLWGYNKNSNKKRDQRLYTVSQNAVSAYSETDSQAYYDVWLCYYKSSRKQKKILNAQKRADEDRYDDVLIEEYQNYPPKTVKKPPEKPKTKQQIEKTKQEVKNNTPITTEKTETVKKVKSVNKKPLSKEETETKVNEILERIKNIDNSTDNQNTKSEIKTKKNKS